MEDIKRDALTLLYTPDERECLLRGNWTVSQADFFASIRPATEMKKGYFVDELREPEKHRHSVAELVQEVLRTVYGHTVKQVEKEPVA